MRDAATSLLDLCTRHGILALYLFGSRVEDGLERLAGVGVDGLGSDLDVGVVFDGSVIDYRRLGALQVELEDLFAPLRVDLVPLQRVDPLFQFAAIDGRRIAATDTTRADLFELLVMRRAAEALPIERERERQTFGVTSR
jgi:predicted nucleotidyltransferase